MQANGFSVGLTGGIGSGKTVIGDMFRELGADVIDADVIARDLVRNHTPLFREIVDHFGEDILDDEGDLDRRRLRERIFGNPADKTWLESLLHPAIRREIMARTAASKAPYVVLVVPLLVESGAYDFVDRVLVVDVPESLQVSRARQRDESPEEVIRGIMASQATREERLAKADDIISNDGTLDAARAQVRQLHERYLQAAASRAKD